MAVCGDFGRRPGDWAGAARGKDVQAVVETHGRIEGPFSIKPRAKGHDSTTSHKAQLWFEAAGRQRPSASRARNLQTDWRAVDAGTRYSVHGQNTTVRDERTSKKLGRDQDWRRTWRRGGCLAKGRARGAWSGRMELTKSAPCVFLALLQAVMSGTLARAAYLRSCGIS